MCTWNATDKGKPQVLGQKLVQWTERNWNWFLSPILSDFTPPLSLHKTPFSHSILAAPTLHFVQMTASLTRHFCPPSYEGLCDSHDSYMADLSVFLTVQSFRLQDFSSAILTALPLPWFLFYYPDFSLSTLISFRLPWLSSVTLNLFGYTESLQLGWLLFGYADFSSATLISFRIPWLSSATQTLYSYPAFSSATLTLFGYPDSLRLPWLFSATLPSLRLPWLFSYPDSLWLLWLSSATFTKAFPYVFLSSNANARV